MAYAHQDLIIEPAELTPNQRRLALSSAPKRGRLRIIDVPEGRARTQLIRLGIMKGEAVRCVERLPGGTVVIEKNRQEIAIGASLARNIMVDLEATGENSQSLG